MRVTFLDGPLSGRWMYVSPGTATVTVPMLPPTAHAVFTRPEDPIPELRFETHVYRIIKLFGRWGEAHGVLS